MSPQQSREGSTPASGTKIFLFELISYRFHSQLTSFPRGIFYAALCLAPQVDDDNDLLSPLS